MAKGISNLVATILLIVVATILCLIIYAWLVGWVQKCLSWVEEMTNQLIVQGSNILNNC